MISDAPVLGDCAPQGLPFRRVLGMRVDQIDSCEASDRIMTLAAAADGSSRGSYVCAANVHMTMEAHDDHGFRAIVNGADLVLPDGQPMVWALRALGAGQRHRVRMTPDLVIDVLAAAEAQGVRLGLYGGTEATLGAFSDLLSEAYPGLTVVYAWSPPFRALSPEEDRQVAAAIAGSRVQLLLVGIGCPKQEKWMAAHVAPGPGDMPRALTCAMVGVGAAFDVFGGRTREAPHWTQGIGLEWLFRLACEPRRLWRRQLHANPRFIALFLLQLVGACARVRAGVRGAS